MDYFPEKLNLLYVSKIGEFLTDINTRYIVKPFSENEFFISYEPSVYFGRLKDIFDYICYDYDILPMDIKMKYKKDYKSFERIDGNLYHLTTKTYNFNQKKKM